MKPPFTLDQLAHASVEEIIDQAYIDARSKLARIIEREGDADGKRLEPEYFDQLVMEEIRAMLTTQQYWNDFQNKRKSSAPTDNHTLLPANGFA